MSAWQRRSQPIRPLVLGGARIVETKHVAGIVISLWREGPVWHWRRLADGQHREGTATTRNLALRVAVWA